MTHLFTGDGAAYAILDGAGIPDLLQKLHEMAPPFECLYRGELQPDIAAVAPYLVRLEPGNPFTAWVLEKGWGNNWGIFAVSQADLPFLRRYFRRFLTVHDESGKPLLFRFYDPRVFRTYLPTCNSAELGLFFESVSHYIVESAGGKPLLKMQRGPGGLVVTEHAPAWGSGGSPI